MIKTDIDSALKRMAELHPKVIDLSLGRTLKLLAKLGNPHKKLPPVIHVAGTNGKGSTIAFMRSILEHAGLSVHTYTSPHLVHFNERISLVGKHIDDATLCELLERVEKTNNKDEITFFEITTCAAFLAFSEHDADVVIIETGLGGRLDTTNVIDTPALTVITPISIDHCSFLGDTIEKIADEKAHIIKENADCIVATQPYEKADQIINNYAKSKNADIYHYRDDISDFPKPSLLGKHQIDNAKTAVTAIQRLYTNNSLSKLSKLSESDLIKAIQSGIKNAKWQGRMQNITKSSLGQDMPNGSEIWIDGGHNEAAGKAIKDVIKNWDDMPLYIVLGMLTTKDASSFIKHIAAYAKEIYTAEITSSDAGFNVKELAKIAEDAGAKKVIAAGNFENALKMIKSSDANRNRPYRILVCGSLYLIGTLLEAIESPR
jgi:dihydrofolate synthase/folylpolyglutamate synthase